MNKRLKIDHKDGFTLIELLIVIIIIGILATIDGFTLIELLIVIIIIGILATISVVSYNGLKGRSEDARRISDMQSIEEGLAQYKMKNGKYPDAMPTAGTTGADQSWGWELSTSGTFLSALVVDKDLDRVPLDPINDSTYHYRYFKYPAGSYGCDATLGDFYVIEIAKTTTVVTNPGFKCSGRDWSTETSYVSYVYGAYTD